MGYSQEYRPQHLQSDNLVLEELPDELMIYDPERNKAFCLNQAAAFVWKHADGSKTVTEIADLLAQKLDRPANEEVVWLALDVLAKDGLLVSSPALPEVPAGVTRRALLQKFGAGAAVAAPLVTVLLVSPAKAHASSMRPLISSPSGTAGPLSTHHNSGFWRWLEDLF